MKTRLLLGIVLCFLSGCGVSWFPGPSATVTVLTTALPNPTLNTAYTQTLSAAGGKPPYSWSVTSGTLPSGLTLSTTGTLSGTPTTAGTSTFTVQVSDSSTPATTASRDLTLQVASATTTPTTLSPGATITLGSGQSVRVPSGTTINLNGTITNVTGDNQSFTTSAGAVVTVPQTATGVADNTVTAQ